MAELLGIVAGGAGLVSLALQLVDGGQKLRNRYKNAKGLEGNILWLGQDLELIGQQLIQLESSAYIILQEQLGPIMLERCRSRSACVAARLDSLTQAMPVTISKRELIQATLRSGQWKSELEELQCLVTGLKQDISQLYIIEHHTLMQQTRKEVIIKDNECAPSAAVSSTQVAACTGYSNMDQQGITQRSARKCSCSCHKNCTISGVFWRLQYSPLLGMFRSCSNTSCTARRYRIDIHLALYRYGIPFQVTALLDLIVEPGRYSLQPSLEIETTVDFTAPQFEILRKLNTKEMEWVTAEKELRSIYRSNPRFVNQVNPSGQGFLEYAHGIIATPGIMFNLSFEILRSLYGLFMNEFHTNESCHSVGLMKTLGRLATANSDSRDLVVSLVSMGCDFRDTAPTAETWDLAPVAFIHSDYDAFLQALLKRNPDFADSPPLHYSVLHDSDKAFEILVKQISQPLEHHVNFLGQTPLHLAVRQPLRVLSLLNAGHEIDPRDKGGITPLVYAAAEDVHDSILILVGRGASLVTGNLGLTVAHYLGGRSDWDLLWKILDLAPTTELDVICQVLHEALRMFRKYEWYSTYESDGMQDGCLNFWTKVVTKLGSPNTIFDDGETLMSHARCPKDVNALIELGFGQFNYRDNYGMNCLFSMAYLTSPSLFRLDVLNGADIETQDNRGHSVLRMHLELPICREFWLPEFLGFLEILDFIMDHKTSVTAGNSCSCPCSADGCLPGSNLGTDSGLGWLILFEWVEILEERGLVSEAKSVCLAYVRKTYFDELGLRHTSSCCKSYGRVCEIGDGRFWDISEQVKIDDFNSQMQNIFERGYNGVKLEAMVLQRRKWAKNNEVWRSWPVFQLPGRTKNALNSKRNREILPFLDVIKVTYLARLCMSFACVC